METPDTIRPRRDRVRSSLAFSPAICDVSGCLGTVLAQKSLRRGSFVSIACRSSSRVEDRVGGVVGIEPVEKTRVPVLRATINQGKSTDEPEGRSPCTSGSTVAYFGVVERDEFNITMDTLTTDADGLGIHAGTT